MARRILGELSAAAEDWLTAEKVAPSDRQQSKVALLRYKGQGGEVAVSWTDSQDGLEAAFAAAHTGLYGFTLDAPIELVTLRVEAVGHMPQPARPQVSPGTGAQVAERLTVHLPNGPARVAVYDRTQLGAGDHLEGPAI